MEPMSTAAPRLALPGIWDEETPGVYVKHYGPGIAEYLSGDKNGAFGFIEACWNPEVSDQVVFTAKTQRAEKGEFSPSKIVGRATAIAGDSNAIQSAVADLEDKLGPAIHAHEASYSQGLECLTPEQREALIHFRNTHGRSWKTLLLQGWERSKYPGPLQQIRNQYGPEWLAKLPLSAFPKESGKTFTPTPEMIETASDVMLARAEVEAIRPIVRGYQQKILQEGQWPEKERARERKDGVRVILDPQWAWLMSEENFAIYDAKCKEARVASGLSVNKPDNCPLLEAESRLRNAERRLMDTMASVTKVDADRVFMAPNGLERAKEYVELSLKLLGPYVARAVLQDAKTLIKKEAKSRGMGL